jgi:hypothetical protein
MLPRRIGSWFVPLLEEVAMEGQAAQNVNRPPGVSGAERAELLARMLDAIYRLRWMEQY